MVAHVAERSTSTATQRRRAQEAQETRQRQQPAARRVESAPRDTVETSGGTAARAPEDQRLAKIARAAGPSTGPVRGLSMLADGPLAGPASPPAPSAEDQFLAKDRARKVKSAERMLRQAGWKPGNVDGKLTERSRAALEGFQKAWGMEPTGELDRATFDKLKHTTKRAGNHKGSLGVGQRGERVAKAERELRRLGYDVGRADGVFDRKAAGAVRDFKRDQDDVGSRSGILGKGARKVLDGESRALNHAPFRRRVKDTAAQRKNNEIARDAANKVHGDDTEGLGVGATHKRAVKHVQSSLFAAGFDPKRSDGVFDERTAGMVKQLQKKSGLEESGRVDGATWRALRHAHMEADGATSPAQAKGERSAAVLKSERLLKKLGHDPGKVDGLFDADTQRASRAFEKKHKGTGDDGRIGARQLSRMKKVLKKQEQPDLNTVKGCAQFLLKSKNVSFSTWLSTGSDEANIRRLARGEKAYVPARGWSVTPPLRLMQGLVAMAKAGPIEITALTGGVHSQNSNHYRGTAVDISIHTGNTAEIQRIGRRYGGIRNYERTHIHMDF